MEPRLRNSWRPRACRRKKARREAYSCASHVLCDDNSDFYFFPLAGVLTLFPQVRFEHIQLGGGAAAARALAALRSGSLRTIDMNHLQALISMPSFHAIVAAAWCYAAWPLRASFPIVCAINLAMIVSALTVGCHYLCDVVAGACVAAAWIWAIEKLYRGPSVRHMRLAPASQNRNCDKPAAALTL